MKKGNCYGLDPGTMMPIGEQGAGGRKKNPNHDSTTDPISTDELEHVVAARYCNDSAGECPVKQECFDYAVGTAQKFGVWGGECSKVINKAIKIRKNGHYNQLVGQY